MRWWRGALMTAAAALDGAQGVASGLAVSTRPSPPLGGFHRRPLPPPSISLSSARGKQLAKQAVAAGSMEGYWAVASAFRTQDEPSFCGLGTLVTALNALELDPGAVWKGAWRWYHESMLDCCVDLEQIKENGIDFDSWLCLARCQGLHVEAERVGGHVSVADFRQLVRSVCSAGDDEEPRILCVSYSRRVLKQSGDGHFSPIGGYHEAEDLVLVMDVARFKHPPHWVPLSVLWEAMEARDTETGLARGFALLSRPSEPWGQPTLLKLTFGRGRLTATRAFFGSELAPLLVGSESAVDELWRAMRSLPAAVASLLAVYMAPDVPVRLRPDSANELVSAKMERVSQALDELRATPLYAALSEASNEFRRRTGPLPVSLEAGAALLLVLRSVHEGCLGGSASLQRALPLSHGLIDESLAAINGPLAHDVRVAANQISLMAEAKAGSYGCCGPAGCGEQARECCSSKGCAH